MTAMLRTARRLIESARPPEPVDIVEAADPRPQRPAIVAVGVAVTLREAIEHAVNLRSNDAPRPILIVPDRRRQGALPNRALGLIESRLREITTVTIAVPAIGSNVNVPGQGDTGHRVCGQEQVVGRRWRRVVFGPRSTVLEHCDVPVEFGDEWRIVAASAPAGEGSIRLWREYVHPNSELRARLSPDASVELALAIPADYLVLGRVGATWLAGHTSDVVAAELLARGLERLRERSRGIDGPGPWEDGGIQHLTELGAGASLGTNIVLRVAQPNPKVPRIVIELSELLGSSVERAVLDMDEGFGHGEELRR